MASAAELDSEIIGGLIRRMQNRSKLTIFVVGNVGSGKSTLVNSLLGWEAAEAGASLEAVTKKIEYFGGLVSVEGPIGDVTTTVWDSPGLQDPDVDKEILLKKISEKCSGVDLVIYCIPMTKIRLDVGEVTSICDITKALGVSIWEKALFVLTFANQLELPKTYDKGCILQEYFYQRKEEWAQILCKKLVNNARVDSDIALKVPVVAAGYDKEPLSYLKETDTEPFDWYQEFWSTCCRRVACEAFPAFLMTFFHIEKYASDSKFLTHFFSSEKFRKKFARCVDTSLFLGFVKTVVAEFDKKYSEVGELWLKACSLLLAEQQEGEPEEVHTP